MSVLLDEGMLCIKMHIRLVPVTLEMVVCVCVTYLEVALWAHDFKPKLALPYSFK